MKRFQIHKGVTIALMVVLIAGAAGAGFGVAWTIKSAPSVSAVEAAKYSLLASRIFDGDSGDTIINFVPLRKTLNERFRQVTAKKSLYFEYLPDGTSIRIGADENLIAASLLKVPMAMNLYKAAELGRIKLDDKVTITKDELDDNYGELYKRGEGFKLTYRQAAQYLLEQSDNTASHVIYDHVKDVLRPDEQALAQLDVDQDAENGQSVVNARSYTSIIKGLYLAAFLNNADSQELLGYLTHSDETERLTKLLPNSVTVAHKNGVYNTTSWAQSDCGVVYLPKRPYMLCVMVGLPNEEADALISQVSKDVYDFVISQ